MGSGASVLVGGQVPIAISSYSGHGPSYIECEPALYTIHGRWIMRDLIATDSESDLAGSD